MVIKRIIDITCSMFALLILSPIIVVTSILIKITSDGNILFIHKRQGYREVPFYIIKFRSMMNPNKIIKSTSAKRITPFGKIIRRLKIDEIPNLYNVLIGEMSLVGPRAKLVEEVAEFPNLAPIRQSMRPGLTGWSQVNGNIHLSIEEMYKLDIWYVKNYNLILDIKIILMTLRVVIFGEIKNKKNIE